MRFQGFAGLSARRSSPGCGRLTLHLNSLGNPLSCGSLSGPGFCNQLSRDWRRYGPMPSCAARFFRKAALYPQQAFRQQALQPVRLLSSMR